MGNFYLTTTLPYVNADPHIGFAYELIVADVIARAKRLQGDNVFFSTGTDEHGQKLYEAAQKAGEDTEKYVDRYALEFKKLGGVLGIQEHAFIRTTDGRHKKAAAEMWNRCSRNGDIYKKKYRGLYCVGCERFLSEKDIADGVCVIHKKAPVELEEENYFFAFKKYESYLLDYLSRPGVIVPEWRREEAVQFVKGGLEDFSISREKKRLSWGVPVPGDDEQVMYVWFDALTSYISTLGWPDDVDGHFLRHWEKGETLQLAGKDQVRFQSLMWQAMLKSAQIKATDAVFYHGFINSGGQKMSKSLGNVISPLELVEKYGTEATRYLLLRHVHPFEDSDVTKERLDEWYEAGLVNGLGNLVSRVMKLAEDNLPSPYGRPQLDELPDGIAKKIFTFEPNAALDELWGQIQFLDGRIQSEEPFKLVKVDREAGVKKIYSLVEGVYFLAHELRVFMPETSERIKEAIRMNKKPTNLFPRLS